jgi:hypothetical protein
MSQYYDVMVAHYGHPRLPGAKHWAIIVVTDPGKRKGWAYQIEGSTNTYSVKQPEEINLLSSNAYMGSVRVGCIHKDWAFGPEPTSLNSILMGIPTLRGSTGWNCQNWVVSGLGKLRDAQHSIDQVTLQDLQSALAQAKREDQ